MALVGFRVNPPTGNYAQAMRIDIISEKLKVFTKSLEALNEKLRVFSKTISSSKGLRLTDKQQTILIAFEFLNRAEQRLDTLQKLKIVLGKKQLPLRLKKCRN